MARPVSIRSRAALRHGSPQSHADGGEDVVGPAQIPRGGSCGHAGAVITTTALLVVVLLGVIASRRRTFLGSGDSHAEVHGRSPGPPQSALIEQMRAELAATRAEVAALSAARTSGAHPRSGAGNGAAGGGDSGGRFALGARSDELISNGAVWPPPEGEHRDACLLLLTHGRVLSHCPATGATPVETVVPHLTSSIPSVD